MDSSLAHLISWSEPTKGDMPPPLTGPSITISPLPAPHPPTVFLFGGKFVHNRKLTNEMWAMDLFSRVWSRVDTGQGPGARYFHSMDVYEGEDKLVCFGGMSETDPMSVHHDVWFFDCVNRKWLPSPSPGIGLGIAEDDAQDPNLVPAARYAHLSAVSRGKLVVSGGQHSDNSWIYEVNVFDLKRKLWVSKTDQPELQGLHSKGAYRSVAASSRQRVIYPKKGDVKGSAAQTYSIDEEGEGGDVWCYSNYDFAKVRRELDCITPLNEDSSPADEAPSKHNSPPNFHIQDQSIRMHGPSQPPGLRFPTGGIVGNHFILCGLYLASSSAAFSIWALDLNTMLWRHLEPTVLAAGSWNRAVLWPEKAKILVFGNTDYDLASDYGRRAVNLDHLAVVSLETYGIYRPPKLEIGAKVHETGLTMLDEKIASDFEVICDDGRRVKCSRRLLSDRWPWFAQQERELSDKLAGAIRDAPTLDIADTLLGSFTPARLGPTSLTIPEPFPVCVALVQYFYTLSLATPLQNRAPVLSALLFLAKQYKIERLGRLVVHALHERLEPSLAVGIYEIATLSGEQSLQVRALNMIHSAKAASASRSHKQGPPGSLISDGRSASPNPPTRPTSTSQYEANGPKTATMSTFPTDEGSYKRARAESMTLGDKDADEIDALLSALVVTANDASAVPSPISRSGSPMPATAVPRRVITRPTPTIGPVPPGRIRRPQLTPDLRTPELYKTPDLASPYRGQMLRPSSPTNSDSTSPCPPTPSESIRESFIIPREQYPINSRSSSTSSQVLGRGLPILPEDSHILNRSFRSDGGGSMSALNMTEKRLNHSSSENGLLSPSTSMSSRAAPSSPRAPPQSLSSYQAQAISSHFNTTDPFSRISTKVARHFSVQTASTAMSDASSYRQSRQDVKSLVPSSPVSTEYSFTLEEPSRMDLPPPSNLSSPATPTSPAPSHSPIDVYSYNPMGRSFTYMPVKQKFYPSVHKSNVSNLSGGFRSTTSLGDTASVRTFGTSTSDKKTVKAEKKAIQAADKAAKKAEAQAKFEALRSEQMRKIAEAKVAAQRKAESQRMEPPTAKPPPKTKMGKFGAKLSDAVLFPAGNSDQTMF